ncbi:hypothetical protein V2P20_06020 [Methylobacter sp. Wu1]|uniref:hypothetical protein n=1 Tax=Methylobacter sp. Wu1 TaxID=3119359 RepID=UPI002F932A3E
MRFLLSLMKKFKLGDNTECLAEDFIDGHLVNPVFKNGLFPESPFILRMEHQFSVHNLVNGCLKCLGVFNSLNEALNYAKNGYSWRNETYA